MADFDLELEDINPILDLVTFENTRTSYPRDRPLSLIYSIGKEFTPSKRDDWIGIFQSGWHSVSDYLAYRWAPTVPRKRNESYRRSILFSEVEIQGFANDVDTFQFLYVTKGNDVVGVSKAFRFANSNINNQKPLQNSSSFSFVDVFSDCTKNELQNVPGFHTDLHFDTLEHYGLGIEDRKSLDNISNSSGSDIDLCFDVLERAAFSSGGTNILESDVGRKRSLSDTFEIVCESTAPEVRKKTKTKQKILNIYRNPDSLKTDIPAKPWTEKLRIVHVEHPIVQEYIGNKEKAVVPFVPIKPLYDAAQTKTLDQEAFFALATTQQPSLEFPLRLSLLPGPQSVLMGMKIGSKSCSTCALGIDLVSHYIRRNKVTSEKMEALQMEVKELRSQIQDIHMKNFMTSFQQFGGTTSYSGQLEKISNQNESLKRTIENLQNQIQAMENEKREYQQDKLKPPIDVPNKLSYSPDDCLQDAILILSKRGYKALITPEENRVNLEDLSSTSSDEDEMWQIRSPRRIKRLKNIISKQDAAIENANSAVSTQRNLLKKKTRLVRSLRKDIVKMETTNRELSKKLGDMTVRIRSILRGRAKELTNEWRMLARRIRDDPFLEPENRYTDYPCLNTTVRPVTCGQTSVTRGIQACSINDDVTSFRNMRSRNTRICKTCGVTFTPDVDPRVYEEHLVFHQRYQKKTQ